MSTLPKDNIDTAKHTISDPYNLICNSALVKKGWEQSFHGAISVVEVLWVLFNAPAHTPGGTWCSGV